MAAERQPDDLVWGEPPTIDGRRGPTPHPMWAQLKAKPGRWARTPLSAKSVSQLRRRYLDFEFMTRTIDGETLLWARYVGGPK